MLRNRSHLAAGAVTLVAGLVTGPLGPLAAATLEVGPQKPFAKIEAACIKAESGHVILVHPREENRPYEQVAVIVRKQRLIIRAAPAGGKPRVTISGQGFEYSGAGNTPRAIFQFDPGADDCVLEGFELTQARNRSHNGAGVRINQASRVKVLNCNIHDNNMGIMSNGDGTPSTAVDLRIENCEIHHNGDPEEPGQNHNLYLGGTSVTLSGCEVHHSLTGHNVKSRAHYTRVEYCYIHDSANREFDLVDAADTARPGSDAVLLGNIIVKNPKCPGNRGVIHFGQDGKNDHDGTLHLAFNTVVTPFIGPVIDLSTPGAKARLTGNIICDGGQPQRNQQVANARDGAKPDAITGQHNWFSGDFAGSAKTLEPGLDPGTNRFDRGRDQLFRNPARHDYALTPATAKLATTSLTSKQFDLPAAPGSQPASTEPPLKWQYRHPSAKASRPDQQKLTLGAQAR